MPSRLTVKSKEDNAARSAATALKADGCPCIRMRKMPAETPAGILCYAGYNRSIFHPVYLQGGYGFYIQPKQAERLIGFAANGANQTNIAVRCPDCPECRLAARLDNTLRPPVSSRHPSERPPCGRSHTAACIPPPLALRRESAAKRCAPVPGEACTGPPDLQPRRRLFQQHPEGNLCESRRAGAQGMLRLIWPDGRGRGR